MFSDAGDDAVSRRVPPGASRPTDYGWRLRGRPVGVLEDRSFRLDARRAGDLPASALLDAGPLQACLQCGTCTATCNLSEDGSLFPRREMQLAQLGQHRQLVADPLAWTCYGCMDCSERCPSGAQPGLVLAAVRRMAAGEFAVPRVVARAFASPRGLPLVVGVPAILLAAVVGLFGSLRPQAHPVVYATMFPHRALNVVCLTATALGVAAASAGLARAWRAWTGEPLHRADRRALALSLAEAMREVLAQRRFAACAEHPLARPAHLAICSGFAGLVLVAALVAVLLPLGLRYPLGPLHPLKVAGNLAGAALVLGTAHFVVRRTLRPRTLPTSWHDGLFLGLVLTVGATGFAVEALRFADVPAAAYAAYFVHLVAVLVLLAGAPFSKLCHAVYRPLAMAASSYAARMRGAGPRAAQARRPAA